MQLPSKELLNKVLGIEVNLVLPLHTDNITEFYTNSVCNYFINGSYSIEHKYKNKINTYELAHKCKEWAWSTGLQLTTFKGFNSKWYCEIPKGPDEETHRIAPKKMSFNSNTEPEAIFKACQSILDNRRN